MSSSKPLKRNTRVVTETSLARHVPSSRHRRPVLVSVTPHGRGCHGEASRRMPGPCRCRVAVAIVILGLALARCRGEKFFRGVPLSVDDNRGLLVPCAAAGQTVMLLLDTGATHSSLRPDVARELGLAEAGDALVDAVGATRRVPVARLPSLAVGDVTVFDLPVLVFDPALDRGATGLVWTASSDRMSWRDSTIASTSAGAALSSRWAMNWKGACAAPPCHFSVSAIGRSSRRCSTAPAAVWAWHSIRAPPTSCCSIDVEAGGSTGSRPGLRRASPRTQGRSWREPRGAAARSRAVEGAPGGGGDRRRRRTRAALLPLVLFDEVYVNNRLGWIKCSIPAGTPGDDWPGRQVADPGSRIGWESSNYLDKAELEACRREHEGCWRQ